METVSYQQDRIQNMAIYFVENMQNVGMTKLMKLYYFCDRKAYLETGFKITDLEYIAEKRGPVLIDLYKELEDMEAPCLFGVRDVIQRERPSTKRTGSDELPFRVKKNKRFSRQYFSVYELSVLDSICKEYKNKTGAEMSMESHEDGLPWIQTWDNGKGLDRAIDFDLDIEKYLDTDRLDAIRYAQSIAKTSKEWMESL